LSAFDLLNGSLELLIVIGCVLESRAVIRRYWTRGSVLPSRPSGLVWLSLLTTVAVFYFLAALQAFGVPLRNGTIEAVLGIGFIGVHVAHLAALGIRERRRRLISYAGPGSSGPRTEALPSSPPPLRVDPGWAPAVRGLGFGGISIGPVKMLRGGASPQDGLTALRIMFISILVIPFLYLFALAFIVPWDGGDESWVPWVVTAVGAYAVAFVLWVRRRPLDLTSPERLARSYRANVFIRIGLAEAAVLAGLVGVFVTGSLWIYLVGIAFGLVGLSLAAPSVRDTQRRQEEIAAMGSALSLVEVLTSPRQSAGGLGKTPGTS
jgi:hypothetical protein